MRVPRSRVPYLRDARVVEEGEKPTMIARFDSFDRAFHGLLPYGPNAEVLEPRELRDRIARTAAETAALYSSSG